MIANQTSSSAIQTSSPWFLIFTDARGNVIFADQDYMNLSGGSPAELLGGKPLHHILPIDAHSTHQLIEMVRRSGHIDGMPLPVRTAGGALQLSNGVAVAAHDEYDDFIGIDLILRQVSTSPGIRESKVLTHAEVLKTHAESIVAEGNLHASRTFIQSYLAAQMEALQIILARIAGPAARLALERLANQTAEHHALPISIQNGHLLFFKKDIGLQGYQIFLDTAIRYAVDVLGERNVKREMLTIDRFIAPGTLELIAPIGPRIFFTK